MLRHNVPIRRDLDKIACDHGFDFHVIDNEIYWDESRAYRFTLRQIEEQIEKPTAELHQMCLEVVERAVRDEQIMQQLAIRHCTGMSSPKVGAAAILRFTGGWISSGAAKTRLNCWNTMRIRRRRSMSPPTFNGYGWRMPVVAAPSRVMPINTTRYRSG